MHYRNRNRCKRWLSLVILPLLATVLLTSCVTASMLLNPGGSQETDRPNPDVPSPEGDDPSAVSPLPGPGSTPATGPVSGLLKVHFLDVGQGDAIFIELPTKETMLIDAADSSDAPGIIDYIRKAGYSRLDYVVATHPHADHIGGMAEVVRSLDIGSFYMPKKAHTTKTFENMLLALKAKNIGIHSARAGVILVEQDGLSISMVAPAGETYPELNDYSAVIRLDYGATSFLFMGDAETKSEDQIIADIDVDVLKVGHHGSDSSTSESLLDRSTPDHAVISTGEGNTYGHPNQATLDALKARGISIYRTDLSGTLVFTSDGTRLQSDKEPQAE